MYSNLYVIGNGFDLHHDMNSRYSDFSDYVRHHNIELYDTINNTLEIHVGADESSEWALLEECLGRISPSAILESISQYIEPLDSDDYFRSLTSAEDEQQRLFDILEVGIKEEFYNWLAKIVIPQNQTSNILKISDNSCFLSFNYTQTLSKIYGINKKDIRFIHGCIDDEESIILGHGDPNPDLLKEAFEYDDQGEICGDGYYPLSMDSINSDIENYFSNSFKNVADIISENADFFEELDDVQNVYILGHSLALLDLDYFKLIKNSVSTSANWSVSYYSDNEKVEHEDTLLRLGIDRIKSIRLSDFQT